MAIQAGKVVVTSSTAVQLVAATGRDQTNVVIRQAWPNSVTVFVGGSSAGAATGFQLPVEGTPVSLTLDKGDELWAVTESGTAHVHYITNNK